MNCWSFDICCYSFLGPTCWRWCVPLLNQMQEFSSWLLRNWQKQRKKKCFPNPVSAVFYSLYSPPFATKIIRFLRLIRCLYNANSFLFIWPLRLDKSLRICTKKNWFCRCRNSVAIPILFQLRLLILTWFRAISSYSNYTLSFMTC